MVTNDSKKENTLKVENIFRYLLLKKKVLLSALILVKDKEEAYLPAYQVSIVKLFEILVMVFICSTSTLSYFRAYMLAFEELIVLILYLIPNNALQFQ